MAKNDVLKAEVKRLMVEEGFNLAKTASKVGVAASTLRSWRKKALADGDDWDKARALFLLSKDGAKKAAHNLLNGFYQDIQSAREELAKLEDISASERVDKLARLADIYAKAASAFGKANPSLDKLAVASSVLSKLSNFIKEKHPKEALSFSLIIEEFGKELVRNGDL